MDLSVKIMSKSDTISSILQFQTESTSSYWQDALFKAYPFLDKDKCLHSTWENKKQYLMTELSTLYDKIYPTLQNKCTNSQKIWDQNKTNINHIFSQVFNLDCAHLFNNKVAEISLNPICPRNIRKQSYSVAWGGDETNFLKTSLHEMIHFVWFYIWKKHFKDKWNEYEAPNIKWILSELVIDTIVKNTDINLIFPQPHKEKPAYQYFYNMKIGDNFILTELSQLYHDATNITIFMEQAYHYCLSNEELIRKQML